MLLFCDKNMLSQFFESGKIVLNNGRTGSAEGKCRLSLAKNPFTLISTPESCVMKLPSIDPKLPLMLYWNRLATGYATVLVFVGWLFLRILWRSDPKPFMEYFACFFLFLCFSADVGIFKIILFNFFLAESFSVYC